MDRRQFLATSLAAATPVPDGALLVVDTHQHLWDLHQFKLPWIEKGSPLAHTFTLADYRHATAGQNVVKAIYMEVDVAPEQQQAEADWVRGLCQHGGGPTIAAVVSGRPGTKGFAKYARQFHGDPFVKGIRRVLHVPETPPGTCVKPAFVRDVRLLGQLGLRFDLCMRAADLSDAEKLIAACPNTRFILDHCGNPVHTAPALTAWRKDLAAVAKRPNVVCKVSGIVAAAKKGWTADDLAPIVHHVLDQFGPDRVMFGGDWPVCTLRATYRQWIEALRTIVANRPMTERLKLFHDNAVRFYGLS